MSNLIEEAIREHWGERCPDFDPGCPCCRAWAEFDQVERLRTAMQEMADHPTGGVGCNPEGFVKAARAALEKNNV